MGGATRKSHGVKGLPNDRPAVHSDEFLPLVPVTKREAGEKCEGRKGAQPSLIRMTQLGQETVIVFEGFPADVSESLLAFSGIERPAESQEGCADVRTLLVRRFVTGGKKQKAECHGETTEFHCRSSSRARARC